MTRAPPTALLALCLGLPSCEGGCSGARPAPTEPESKTPQSPAIGPNLRKKLQAALEAKGTGYVPRTKHKTAAGVPKYTNRLILESSPYLLQHAHNPVNWFPWGDEAFEFAKATKRPVFLSVGYATCHWCHVMEEESFEDEAIARFINDNYIAIKVDREERPDVDSIYMAAVHMLRQRGGWPMSVWLTPERKPFFGGTYFPARDGDRGTRKGFLSHMREQLKRFKSSPDTVASEADRLAAGIQANKQTSPEAGAVGYASVLKSIAVAERGFDPTFGGMRRSPKFPSSFPNQLLLRHHFRTGNAESLAMATKTLTMMASGGMYDHVGRGFHRYSTDKRWLVPHFEKMLYDNAQLAVVYLEGFRATGDATFARVAREILDYVALEMTHPKGAFYSATDADSIGPKGHREEGYYFTWTPEELNAALGEADSEVVRAFYGVTPRGNFEGRTIFHTAESRDDVAERLGMARGEFDKALKRSRVKLRLVRAKRPAPLLDDKIQVSWNGLMISAFARGAFVLDESKYQTAAENAATFLLDNLRAGGRLKHSYKDGKLTTNAFAEDYAFFAAGLIDLLQVSSDPKWLSEAIGLMNALEKHHADPRRGGYFLTADDHEKLLAREKPSYDGAIPSANSVALMNHLRLSELTTDDVWRQRAEMTIRAFSSALNSQPSALGVMLLGIDFQTDRAKEIVIVTSDSDDGAALKAALRRTFVPNHVYVSGTQAALDGKLGKLVPWAKGKPTKNGKATVYVCEKGSCELPTTNPKLMQRQLTPER